MVTPDLWAMMFVWSFQPKSINRPVWVSASCFPSKSSICAASRTAGNRPCALLKQSLPWPPSRLSLHHRRHRSGRQRVMWTWYDAHCRNVTTPLARANANTCISGLQEHQTFYPGGVGWVPTIFWIFFFAHSTNAVEWNSTAAYIIKNTTQLRRHIGGSIAAVFLLLWTDVTCESVPSVCMTDLSEAPHKAIYLWKILI